MRCACHPGEEGGSGDGWVWRADLHRPDELHPSFINITSMSAGQWSARKGYGPPPRAGHCPAHRNDVIHWALIKIEVRKGYPMCTAGMQIDKPSAYPLCTGYLCKGETDIINICC